MKVLLPFLMDRDIKVDLKVEFLKEKAKLFTLIIQSTKVNGSLVIHMVKACWRSQMELTIKEAGTKGDIMEKEFTSVRQDLVMMANGRMVSTVDKVLLFGQTDPFIEESGVTPKRLVLVFLLESTEQYTKENGLTGNIAVRECWKLQMVKSSQEIFVTDDIHSDYH